MASRATIVFLGISALAFLAAARLPYRTGELVHVAVASPVPDADGTFRVGDLRWDTPLFAREASLEPLRVFFRAHCPGKVGGDAATCVSDAFAVAFPRGGPAHELFDPSYDAPADLAAHLAGEPGHCVTRSGLISAVLLSMGIPAKVVQFVGASGGGHTVMSVWDGPRGWVVYDPSFGTYVTVDGRPTNAGHIVEMPADLASVQAGLSPTPHTVRGEEFYDELQGPGLNVMIPEPWLYMRVGEHRAHAPFRGRFAVLGPGKWNLGPAQDAARGVFVGGILLAFAALVTARLRRTRMAVVTSEAVAPLEPAE